jgi:hypothetical protein
MNTVPGRQQALQMKASDADRDEVVAALSEHFQAGRLTTDELEDRTGRALSARTLGELDVLMSDLPRRPQAKPVAEGSPRRAGLATVAMIAPVLVLLAVVALVVGYGTDHHATGIWVVIPIALIVARRLGRRQFPRRGGPFSGGPGMLTGSRRNWPSEDSRPD